jgi:pilus assembly protein CpaF
MNSEEFTITKKEINMVVQALKNEITGFGPLESLLSDNTVSEIMVNSAKEVYVEKKGKLVRTDIKFRDNQHVLQIIDKIVSPLGRRIDESSPMVDARLPDGSRVNAIVPPLAIKGPCITIRKFSSSPLTIENLISYNSLDNRMAEFIKMAVIAKSNIIVAGGTGSGKTTFLNVLSSFIPSNQRIVTIEDSAELQLNQDHIVSLEARPANMENMGEVTIRDLLKNSLRMRPDRIVVGEVRGAEALDMLQAMNTGHNGSLSTIHSNSPRDAISRLATIVLYSGIDFPMKSINEQISSAIDLIVYVERLSDGSRKVTSITEVLGMDQDTILIQEIFHFEKMTKSYDNIKGTFKSSPVRPKILEKFESSGLNLGAW